MKRLLLAPLLFCAACTSTPAPDAAAPALCRIAPNDGPILAERGIGGTGLPASLIPPAKTTTPSLPAGKDRGLGGTGLPAATAVAATGIAGEITGFASICVNGAEVQYSAATPITIDGAPGADQLLRAGQIVTITAWRQAPGLSAQNVEIRHEVIGPVSALAWDGFVIAGQHVIREPGTRGQTRFAPGSWLAVSGLRNRAGDIVATRIDSAPPGITLIHGTLRGTPRQYAIGALPLQLPPGTNFTPGEKLTVTGTLQNGVEQVLSAKPDLLYTNPQAYFGPATDKFLLEAYGVYTNGFVELANGLRAAAPAGRPARGPAIFSFTRSSTGSLQIQTAADISNQPAGGWARATPLLGPGQTSVPRPGQPNIGFGGPPNMPPGMPPGIGPIPGGMGGSPP